MSKTESGFAHILVLIAAIGLVAFLLVSSTGYFKNDLYAKLFPKQSSFASGPIDPPVSSSNRVFVTSTTYNGNLGGLTGADAKCQSRANAANLGGTWKAWLSDNTTAVSSRLQQSTAPYKLINGTTVANNWSDLTDGFLQNNISLTETGSTHGNYVWSGSKENGEILNQGYSKCDNWTSATVQGEAPGVLGHSGNTDYRWSWGSNFGCGRSFPLYCFEQPAAATAVPTQVPTVVPTAIPTSIPTPTPNPCVSTISPNQTVNGTLTTTDCRSTSRGVSSGQVFYADKYTFSASVGANVSILLVSPPYGGPATFFDTYLYLLNPDGSKLAINDDGGGGSNSRIPANSGTITLPTAGSYTIEVSSFDPAITGKYTLTLTGP